MTSSTRTLLLAFSALGLASSATSSYVHYRLLTEPGFTSFCDVNATVSCTEAYLSRYGSFAGVPVAVLGVIFFAIVLAMAAMAGRRTSAAAEAAPGYIFALSTIGLAFVLYLGYAAYFVLGAFCILCGITYVAVIALFIISGGATSFPMTSLPRRAPRDVKTLFSTPAALGIALLLVAGAATAIAAFPRETAPPARAQSGGAVYPPLTDQQRAEVEKWFDMQPTVEMPIAKGDAKVLVVKFNDYQCPPCRQSYELYGPILDKYTATGQVKFVLKHFPLEPECNPTGSPQTVHPASCEAAAAVVMAEPKGTSGKLEAWLFANQGPPLLTSAQVKEAARDIAGVTDFDAQYQRALLQVSNDAGMGVLLGAKSTPTFFINNTRIAGMVPPPVFEALIELELKRAK